MWWWWLWPLVRREREHQTDFLARTTYGSRSGAYLSEQTVADLGGRSTGPDREQGKER